MALGFFEASNNPAQPDSYDAIQRKRRLAEALAKQGTDTGPIQHWTQGLARLMQAWAGKSMSDEADEKQKANDAPVRKAMLDALGGDVSTPATAEASSAASPSVATAGAPATSPSSVPPGPLTDAIQAAAAKHGIDPAYLTRTAQIESSYGKNLQSPLSSAGGPFAFTNGTARQYGLENKNDANASADAAARLALDNKRALAQRLGRDPTSQELYLAHQQGAGGASALLSNPQANVVDALTPIYKGNRAAALEAIRNNGGSPNMTAGQFAAKWTNKFGGASAAQPAVQTTSPAQLGAVGYAPSNGVVTPEAARAIMSQADLPSPGATEAGGAPFTPPNPYGDLSGTTALSPYGDLSGARTALQPQPSPDVPAAGAVNNAAPVDPILAATAARAANPQPGDQRVPLNSPEAEAFMRLEGQPNPDLPSAGAVPAGGAPMPGRPAMDPRKALLAAALSPGADPRLAAQAMQVYQATQKDQSITQVDLGNSIGIIDGRGNIIRTIPKQKDAPAPITLGPDQRLVDRNGNQLGNAAPEQPKIAREATAREAEAKRLGLDPNEPRVKQFILTGSYPKEPELTSTDKNAIIEADDLVSQNRALIGDLTKAKSLSPKAYGNGAGNMYSGVGSVLGDETARNTVELNNLVTSNALTSMKTIFGGNPTEGERKILLEIQGAGSQPDAVRQKIFDRAIEAANRRLQFNEERAKSLRGGTYYKPPGGAQAAPSAPVADPLGIR